MTVTVLVAGGTLATDSPASGTRSFSRPLFTAWSPNGRSGVQFLVFATAAGVATTSECSDEKLCVLTVLFALPYCGSDGSSTT